MEFYNATILGLVWWRASPSHVMSSASGTKRVHSPEPLGELCTMELRTQHENTYGVLGLGLEGPQWGPQEAKH